MTRDLDDLELALGSGVIDLAVSLSIATDVEPALLRTARRRLHPGLSHEAEATLFHSRLAESQGRHGFTVAERYLDELRDRLLDDGRLESARAVVAEVHEVRGELVQLEDRLAYDLLRDAETSVVDALLGSVVALLRDAPDRRPVGRWILRAFRRAPDRLLDDPRYAAQAFSLIQAASAVLGGATFGRRLGDVAGARPLPVLADPPCASPSSRCRGGLPSAASRARPVGSWWTSPGCGRPCSRSRAAGAHR